MFHFTVAKNTLYQVLAKGTTAFIGFLITILIARNFGVVGYGEFTKITAFIALFYLFIDFGLNAVYLQIEDEKEKNLNKLFYLRILIALFIFILSNLIVFFLPFNQTLDLGFSPFARFGIFIFSFSIFSQSIITSASALFQKKLDYFPYFLSVFLGSLANLITVFICVSLSLSLFYVILSFVISSFITALISIYYIKEKIFPISFDYNLSKKILIQAMPIGIMLVFNLIYFRADMFLLSLLKSSRDVGIYGISYKFFDFILALPLFLSNALYPFLLAHKQNREKFFKLVNQYLFVFLSFSFIVMIPFWFLSPLLYLIKPDYVPAITPFRILLVSIPFFFLTSFLQWVLISLGKQKFLAYVYGISTILNIVLNIIFIPMYSYIASALITGASEFVVFILLAIKFYSVKILLGKEGKNE